MSEPLTIGIVGGMSPQSTITYYQQILRRHEATLDNHGYPRLVIASVSFQQYIDWQHAGAWDQVSPWEPRSSRLSVGEAAASG